MSREYIKASRMSDYISDLRRHTSMTGPRFDEVMAAHDAQVRAEALREAAFEFAEGGWSDAFAAGRVADDEIAARATEAWLNRRADRIGTIGLGGSKR